MNKFWKTLDILEEGVMVAGMAVMVLFNFLNVVARRLLPQTPFSYTEELVVLVFIWVSMFGISYGYRRNAHTVLTVAADRLPEALQPLIIVFAALASALLMSVIAWMGFKMTMNQIRHGQILPGMRIPMALAGAALPLGAVMTVISVLRCGWLELKRWREGAAA
ncbi:MAG: TRAP transporter small permease [Fretibacterium sp.]|nr:TRAP transporter small permease [Fretibacterium sp.]